MRLTLDPPAPKRYGMQPRRRAADPIDLARATTLCWQGPIRPGASQEAPAGGPKNAYGFDFPDGVDETYPVHVNGDVYTDTKVNSKAIVLAAHAAGEIEVTVIRPGDVGGPGSVWVRSPIAEMRKATGFPLPNGGNGIFSPVYIDNFVDGMVLAVSSGDAVGQVFNISDGQGVRCGDFFGQLATMSGGKLRTIPMSVAAAGASLGSRHELSLPTLGGSLHDPLRGPVVDPRCFGGSVNRRVVTACFGLASIERNAGFGRDSLRTHGGGS